MSDQNSPLLAVNPDPDATADDLFVRETSGADDGQAPTGGVKPEVMQITDLAGKRFIVRANHQDHELTADELLTAAQKGMNYDKLTSDYGAAKQKLEPAAANWAQFEAAMLANPGSALATYAKAYDLTVGMVNSDGYFEPVDVNSDTQVNRSQSSSPDVQALSTEVNELKSILTQLVGGLASSQEEQQLMEKHQATADEIKKAQEVASERNLPPGSLDIALAVVRQMTPVAPTTTPEGTGIPVADGDPAGVASDTLSDTEAILQLLKAGNPQLTGGGGGAPASRADSSYKDMTPLQRTQKAWEEAKKEAGITSVRPPG